MQYKNLIRFFLLVFCLSEISYAKNNAFEYGIDKSVFNKPIQTQDFHPINRTTITCFIYPRFALVETDISEKGLAKITLHHFSNHKIPSNICVPNYTGKKIILPAIEGYVLGVIQDYIFLRSADSFGTRMKLVIVNAQNGKIIFSTEYNYNKTMQITFRDNKISLLYYRPLKVNCVTIKNNDACWQKILKDNQIKTQDILTLPDCDFAVKQLMESNSKINENSADLLQISRKVVVHNINTKIITPLKSDFTCDLTP